MYGPATTSASLTTAAAFAFASVVFAGNAGANAAYPGYAADLGDSARRGLDLGGREPERRLLQLAAITSARASRRPTRTVAR